MNVVRWSDEKKEMVQKRQNEKDEIKHLPRVKKGGVGVWSGRLDEVKKKMIGAETKGRTLASAKPVRKPPQVVPRPQEG